MFSVKQLIFRKILKGTHRMLQYKIAFDLTFASFLGWVSRITFSEKLQKSQAEVLFNLLP